jgi:chromosome segregation ATPase
MEPEPDHSNSDHPRAATVASEERVDALIAEKEQLANDLAQAKSAIEASERELADARRNIQELTAERDRLATDKTQVRAAIAISERDLVALKSQVRELTEEKNRLAAARERAQADVESAYEKVRALEAESIFDFVKRRYFSRK